MELNYSVTRKKLFLNNRINEYCLFLKGVNAGIALDNNINLIKLSEKLAVLPLCKAIGISFSQTLTRFKHNRAGDLEIN